MDNIRKQLENLTPEEKRVRKMFMKFFESLKGTDILDPAFTEEEMKIHDKLKSVGLLCFYGFMLDLTFC